MFNKLVGVIAPLVKPKRSVLQMIEDQNTKIVYYSRMRGLPQKYVYGKRPGEPLLMPDWHPDGRQYPVCKAESDMRIAARHSAICLNEAGSHGGLCEMCSKLNNPKRFEFLVRLYRDYQDPVRDGFVVKDAVDGSGLNQPATSEYLRQLASLGLVRRKRNGRFVHYSPDYTLANPCVREIASMIRQCVRSPEHDMSFTPIFRVMMGSLRSRIVRLLAAEGDRSLGSLAWQFKVQISDLRKILGPAIEGGVLALESDDSGGGCHYVVPAHPVARRIVELS